MTVPEIAIPKEIIAAHLTVLTKCFATVTLTPLEVSPHFSDSYQSAVSISPESACLQGFQSTQLTKPLLLCTYAQRALQSVHSNQPGIGK